MTLQSPDAIMALLMTEREDAMPRFFVNREAFIEEGMVRIVGEDASHIARSLRMTEGENLTLSDGAGIDYETEILKVQPEEVLLSVKEQHPSLSEPPYEAILYQCLPKGEKMEILIQKAVECGVSAVVPVTSSRCVALLKDGAFEKKALRWNKIAKEAAKQSGRGRMVPILSPKTFAEAVKEMAAGREKGETSFLCYENEEGRTLFSHLCGLASPPKKISFLIGPEGGLSPEEVALAAENGIVALSLGKRILRTETASSFVLAILAGKYEL